jgi:hypothetical protein
MNQGFRDFARADSLAHELNRCGQLTEAALADFVKAYKHEEMTASLVSLLVPRTKPSIQWASDGTFRLILRTATRFPVLGQKRYSRNVKMMLRIEQKPSSADLAGWTKPSRTTMRLTRNSDELRLLTRRTELESLLNC